MKLPPMIRIHLLVVLVATCSLLYEFVLMDSLTILCGEGIFYHSIVIGLYLFFLGIGAQVSDRLGKNVAETLVRLEILISMIGGVAVVAIFFIASQSIHWRTRWMPQLHAAFPEDASVWSVLARFDALTLKAFLTSTLPMFGITFLFIIAVGILSGLEVPLLMAYYRSKGESRDVPQTLFFDYLGGFAASVIFPFLLLPYLTIFRIGALVGLLNSLAGVYLAFAERLGVRLKVASVAVMLGLLMLMGSADRIQAYIDRTLYWEGPGTEILASFRTPYQKVTLVSSRHGLEKTVYLNNYLQFSYSEETALLPVGVDHHHSVLVHPPLVMHPAPKSVLILGGGDGLPAREALKYPKIERLVNVDIDEKWTTFSRTNPHMRHVNNDSFNDPRLKLVIRDAFLYVREQPPGSYDVILKDFPEGVSEVLARSYSLQFFRDLKRLLRPNGILSVHTDYFGTPSFWTVVKTLRAAGFAHVIGLNHNYARQDSLEGIIYASRVPFDFGQLGMNPLTRFLLERGTLPPIATLYENARPAFVDFILNDTGAVVNSLWRLTYLTKYRQENGFILPLSYGIGPY